MILEIVTIGLIVGQYIYHRLTEEDPPLPRDRIQIPKMEEGVVVPIFYGRVRIRQPVVAFEGNRTAAQRTGRADGDYSFTIDVLYQLGIPFSDGNTQLQGVFFGDTRNSSIINFEPNLAGALGLVGNGPGIDPESPHYCQLQFEFGDGASTQTFAGSAAETALVAAGENIDRIPSWRGFATVFAHEITANTPSIPSISWEVSTYPSPLLLTAPKVGLECNPADVLFDLLSRSHDDAGQLGKLGVVDPIIDSSGTFLTAAQTLLAEGHGYSRVLDRGQTADEIVQEILRQIDGVMYEDMATGLFKLKLVRPDYDPNTIPHITPDNCEGLLDFAAAGLTHVVNKIRVVFTDRSRNYADGSSTAHNQANAVGQNGDVNELILHFPGVCTQALADAICARELAARSRPLAKARAIVDRRFYSVNPGDAIKVTWPEANIAGMVFRVANVSKGLADANIIALDLIQDFFYVHRAVVTGIPESVGSFPGSAVIE